MLNIIKIRQKNTETHALLIIHIKEDNIDKELYLQFNKVYSQYIVTDRIDGIIVGLLNYAFRNKHDIVSTLPVSADLYFRLKYILIPNLCIYHPNFHNINITAPTIETPTRGIHVGTGISCGVDSFYTLEEIISKNYPKPFCVDTLLYNNVGQHGKANVENNTYIYRKNNAAQFAQEFDFNFIECDSNYHTLFPQNHFHCHTFANLLPVFALANWFKIYYYASAGYKFEEIDLSYDDPSKYELFLLPIISTVNLQFYNSGLSVSRFDKVAAVSKFEPSYSYLNVCVSTNHEGRNCGKCEKCIRTLLGLDAVNGSENYSRVFNLPNYVSNKQWYLSHLYYYYKKRKHDYLPIYPILSDQIKVSTKFKVNCKLLKERIIRILYPLKNFILPNIHFYQSK